MALCLTTSSGGSIATAAHLTDGMGASRPKAEPEKYIGSLAWQGRLIGDVAGEPVSHDLQLRLAAGPAVRKHRHALAERPRLCKQRSLGNCMHLASIGRLAELPGGAQTGCEYTG